ncbi:MAG: HD domain-containing protein [Lachnospiraceae bacterium]|nr:HD domain-containing protein [Lachnospiraceae bacterium]
MREITKRLLLIQIMACILSLAGMIFLVARTNSITSAYSGDTEKNIIIEENIERIRSDIYFMEYVLSSYALSDDESVKNSARENIEDLDIRIREAINSLGESVESPKEKEMIHSAAKNYFGFYSKLRIVFDLGKKGAGEVSDIYIREELVPYVEGCNADLEELSGRVEASTRAARLDFSNDIANLEFMQILTIVMVLLSCIIGIGAVAGGGRKIVDTHEKEEAEHAERLLGIQEHIIVSLANLIESRDTDTGEHVMRTSEYVRRIADKLMEENMFPELTEEVRDRFIKAAPLHDVGKIKIPDQILNKPGKYESWEYEIMKGHAAYGGQIIYDIMGEVEEPEYLEVAHDVAMYHHERWDGKGYPEGKREEEIPLCARVMAVADVFDALVSRRCYKEAFPLDRAFNIIEECSGTQFDPRVAGAFLSIRNDIENYLADSDLKIEN